LVHLVSVFLLFTLYAPLASWGEIAVGETRGSWDRPSRSAVLGLLAASLGLVRENQKAHDALESGYGIAVRLDLRGAPLSDYHTAQTVAESVVKKVRPRTRAALLESGDRETILSRRAYRQDALATVAVWERGARSPRWRLLELADALRRPKFLLYAGRKANALGAPLAPDVVSAGSIAEAFAARPPGVRGLDSRRFLRAEQWGSEVAHDAIEPADGITSGLQPFRRDVRRDVSTHRMRWQFLERSVEIGLPNPERTEAGQP
jgi:CRISPR system Cascade subunit CasD